MAELEASLSLDLTEALSQIQDVEAALASALETSAADFTSALATGLSSAFDEVGVDAANAFTGVGLELGDQLVGAAVTAQAAFDDLTVKPAIDTSGIESEVEAALAQVDTTLEIDFQGADAGTEGLTDDLDDLGESGEEAAGGVGDAATAVGAFATATQVAQGELGGLTTGIAGISSASAGAVAGIAGLAVGFGAAFLAGEKLVSSQERLALVFGASAAALDTIDVGGLSGDLDDLAVQAGSSSAALRQAEASAGLVGKAAGLGQEESAKFAEELAALGLRAVALDPSLGDAGAATKRLLTIIGRGGQRLTKFNLGFLTTAEVAEFAAVKFGKTTTTLTAAEKQIAATELAVQKLGDQLGEDFAKGTESSALRLRQVFASLQQSFAEAGATLVEPILDALEAIAPAAQAVARILGDLFASAVPLILVAVGPLKLIASSLELIADVVEAIPGPVKTAVLALIAFRLVQSPLRNVVESLLTVPQAIQQIARERGISNLSAGLEVAKSSAAGLRASLIALGPQLAALAALVGIFTVVTTFFDERRKRAEQEAAVEKSIGDAVNQTATAYTEAAAAGRSLADVEKEITNQGEALFKTVTEAGGQSVDDLTESFRSLGLTIETVGDAISGSFPDAQEVFGALVKNASELETQIAALQAQEEEELEVRGSINSETEVQIQRRRENLNATKKEIEGLKDQIKTEREKVEGTLDDLVATGALTKAQRDLIQARNTKTLFGVEILNGNQALKEAIQLSESLQRQVELVGASSAIAATEMAGFAETITDAIGSIPGVGEALSDVFDALGGAEAIALRVGFGDTGALVADLETELSKVAEKVTTFFSNLQLIGDDSPALAAALAELGPNNLGAQALAQLASTQPQIRAGMETALQGISQAALVAEFQMETLRDTIKAKAAILGDPTITQPLKDALLNGTATAVSDAREELVRQGASPETLAAVDQVTFALTEQWVANQPVTEGVKRDFAKANANAPQQGQTLFDKFFSNIDDSGLPTTLTDPFGLKDQPKQTADQQAAATAGAGLIQAATTGATDAIALAAPSVGLGFDQGVAEAIVAGTGIVSFGTLAMLSIVSASAVTQARAAGTPVGASFDAGVGKGIADFDFIPQTAALIAIAGILTAQPSIISIAQQIGEEIGEAISGGMAIGIYQNGGLVRAAAVGVALSAYLAALNAIDADSPSKLTANIGKFFAEGFALGIEQNAQGPADAAALMAGATVAALATGRAVAASPALPVAGPISRPAASADDTGLVRTLRKIASETGQGSKSETYSPTITIEAHGADAGQVHAVASRRMEAEWRRFRAGVPR